MVKLEMRTLVLIADVFIVVDETICLENVIRRAWYLEIFVFNKNVQVYTFHWLGVLITSCKNFTFKFAVIKLTIMRIHDLPALHILG